ncbi:MAG TPA: hypothetical protein VK939_16390 [Longimicrobiales bacterium]|nr:hypothetical protein [Longimicrobiales bacterium]
MRTEVEERAGTSREWQELLLELAVAVSRYAMYPESHPARGASSTSLAARVSARAGAQGTVSIGVARGQLVVEGTPTPAEHPLLRTLADRLHRQHIGALMLREGVTPSELDQLLRLLGEEAEQGAQPLGLGEPSRLRVSERVRLFPVRYDSLELVGEGETAPGSDTRVSELWIGLARAALARGVGEDLTGLAAPEDVARAINEHPEVAAYDQMIVGYLTQLARELRNADSGAAAEVRERLSRMLGTLDTKTLNRLVSMGGDESQRQQFLMDATDAFSTSAVVDVLEAAAAASGQTISHAMMRLLRKLALHAAGRGASEADAGLRGQVRELIEGWTLSDPNPESYTLALERIAGGTPARPADERRHAAEPLRVLQMALEVDAAGSALWHAVAALLGAGRLPEVIEALERTGAASPVAQQVWRHLGVSDVVGVILATEPVDFDTLDRVLENLPEETTTPLLLDRLTESQVHATRLGILQRIAARGPVVVPALVERLSDERWFVKRNMLGLMAELGVCPPGIAPFEFARHSHPAIRREALLLAVNANRDRERAVALAFADADELVVQVGVDAAREHGFPGSALPLALKALDDVRLPAELRLQVLRVLQDVREPMLLESMLRRVAPKRTLLLRRPRLAPRSPELLAQLALLARGWPNEPRVRAVLARARASGDAVIVRAVEELR